MTTSVLIINKKSLNELLILYYNFVLKLGVKKTFIKLKIFKIFTL